MKYRVNNTQNVDSDPSRKRRMFNVMITLFIIFVLLIIADTTLFGDNIRVYGKWVQCGQAPVEIVSLPGSGNEGYREVQAFEFMRLGHPELFCSSSEAEAAGYRHL